MTKLKPTNESLLGLNDYLSGAIPNMHQVTRSNMIQVKKNKTIKWLHDLPSAEQDNVIELAVRRRAEVSKGINSFADGSAILRSRKSLTFALQAYGVAAAMEAAFIVES